MTHATSAATERRRRDLRPRQPTLNGIDFLEVVDDRATARHAAASARSSSTSSTTARRGRARRRRTSGIDGGERVSRNVARQPASTAAEPTLHASRSTSPGDFSTYTLRLVDAARRHASRPAGSTRSSVGGRLLVQGRLPERLRLPPTQRVCPPESDAEPEIDYLAQGLRQLPAADARPPGRLVPAWRERNAGRPAASRSSSCSPTSRDHLSYQQDAVATEAYLGTARRRISVRRHARLRRLLRCTTAATRAPGCSFAVDPGVGANWPVELPAATQLLTRAARRSAER